MFTIIWLHVGFFLTVSSIFFFLHVFSTHSAIVLRKSESWKIVSILTLPELNEEQELYHWYDFE